MSAAFLPAGRRIHQVKVPTSKVVGRRRVRVKRTTETRDPKLAKRMQAMLEELADSERAWDVLDRVAAKALTVPALWDAWVKCERKIALLRGLLDDVALLPLVDEWATGLASARRELGADAQAKYEHAVRAFVTDGMRRSDFTADAITDHLDRLELAPATVRKRAAGLADFGKWLVRKGQLDRNPLELVDLPSPGDPRTRHLDTPDVLTLADAKSEPYRTLDLLMAGTGLDLSDALARRVRDVLPGGEELEAGGGKTAYRRRRVTIATFARAAVRAACAGKLPDALLVELPNRWNPSDYHRDIVATLAKAGHGQFAGYWLRDHRHTCAVRLVRAGVPFAVVAQQLGHANEALVARVYGRFSPTPAERERWEQTAAKAERRRAAGAA